MGRESQALSIPDSARWIGSDHPFDLHEAYLRFRSPAGWRLEALPEQAELYITADSRYKLWINGRFVGRGPGRSYPRFQCLDVLDVTPYLRTGHNLLAVQVYQPGYSHFAYVHRAMAGMLAFLRCDQELVLVSDPNWSTGRDPSFSDQVRRVSIYGSGVEDRDLNLDVDWNHYPFDDSLWSPARVVALPGAAPWSEIRRRQLPHLAEREIQPTLVESRLGQAAPSAAADLHLELRQGWFSAQRQPMAQAQEGWFRPNLSAGQAYYWLFDLGRDYPCQGQAEVHGAAGSERLLVSYAEKIQDGALVISDPQDYCRVQLTDRFQLRPGVQEAETFSLRGGRYLLFQLVGPTAAELRLRFSFRVTEYPLVVSRKLSAEDPVLAGVIDMCEQTLLACLQDGFVDSTWRESSQWLGDALPQGLILSAMSDDLRPWRQVLEMAAQGAYPDGVLPGVMPGEVHAYTVVDYNFTWVDLLKRYYELSRDVDLVHQLWPTLLKMLDRFGQDIAADGLLRSQPGRRLFLDWSPLSRQEPNAVYNLRYLLALQQAVTLASALQSSAAPAGPWQQQAGALQVAIRAAFWHRGRWYDDPDRTTYSQLAASLAVLTQTATVDEGEKLLDEIAARSLDLNDDPLPGQMVLSSPFMHHYVFEALCQAGRCQQVVEIIRRRWGRWHLAGFPTTWENWNVDFPDGSQCHAFSAHPRYHLARIARAGFGGLQEEEFDDA